MDRLLSLWLPANVSRASKQRNISPGGCYESVNRLLRAFYQIDPETDRDVPSPPEDRYHFSSVSSMETRCLVCVCVYVCVCVQCTLLWIGQLYDHSYSLILLSFVFPFSPVIKSTMWLTPVCVCVLIRVQWQEPVWGSESSRDLRQFWDGLPHTVSSVHWRQLEWDYESMNTHTHTCLHKWWLDYLITTERAMTSKTN